jgi:hypothetical protein
VTDSTTDPAYESPPPNPQVTFGDYITDPGQREAVERSVATHVAHSAEQAAQARAAAAERAKLVAAIQAPFMKQIEEDPEATKALDELRTSRQLIDLYSTDVLRQERPLTATEDLIADPLLRDAPVVLRDHRPPFHFGWSWFRQDGSPPFGKHVIHQTGQVGLDARTGAAEGGASTFVEAHAGFGVVLRTDRSVSARGAHFSKMRFVFNTLAEGIGANATSEGGMDIAAFEDGRLVGILSEKMWRNRVSASLFSPHEEGHGVEGPVIRGPQHLVFPMNPGHEYAYNVGIWVFTDRSTGIGTGGAQSLIEGFTSMMPLWLTG